MEGEINMATIDYKEKYEQALERARQFFEKPYLEDSAGIVGYIFPELKESEDERIRKEIRNFIFNYPEYLIERDSWLAWLEKQGKKKSEEIDNLHNYLYGEQNPWSEEDEKYNNIVVSALYNPSIEGLYNFHKINRSDVITWLKDLKDRVQPQPKQEWNEKDAKMLEDVIDTVQNAYDECDPRDILCKSYEKELDWLKSLKDRVQPQSHWKPSKEQMKALEDSIEFLGCTKKVREDLKSLYEQLKKLMEE